MVVALDELLGGERHLVYGAEEVIDDFRRVGLPRGGDLPGRICADVPRIRNRRGISSCEEECLVNRIGRGIEIPGQPADAIEDEFPFQVAGSFASKPAEFGPAPSPEVVTEPFTSQYCGFGAAAATSVAEVIIIFGTPSALKAATWQSIAQAGDAAMAHQSSAAGPANRHRIRDSPEPFMRTFICDSSWRDSIRCQRVISSGHECHEERKFRLCKRFW